MANRAAAVDFDVLINGTEVPDADVHAFCVDLDLDQPGMATVTRANNGRYYMTYEMVSMPGYALEPRSNPVYFKVSDDGLDWGDPAHPGTLIQDRWRQFPQATPYIVWSPWPAPTGTLIVSARGITRFELGLVGNGMMVNRNYGEGLWTLIETPIRYIPNPCSVWMTSSPGPA